MTFDLAALLAQVESAAPPPAAPSTPPHSEGTALIGVKVGARRWPYSSGHPDTWARPHRGEVLAMNDPRVWRGSVLGQDPTEAVINEHIKNLNEMGVLANSIPVLWEFNPTHAMWEFAPNVVQYEEDVANWHKEKTGGRDADLS